MVSEPRLRRQRRAPAGLQPFLPWADGSGRPWPGPTRLPLAAPFILGYLVVSWALFVPAAEPEGWKYSIDEGRVGSLLYRIPLLTENLPLALRSVLTAPFLNHDSLQLVYVTVLLLAFGLAFEVREGSRRAAALFFGTSFIGALGAGLVLHLVYPEWLDTALLRNAWDRTWSGGSAGAFGLMGALAARARRPWPLLALFLLWETNVALWYLRIYTPAFHVVALATGFALTRWLLPRPKARTDHPGANP